MAGEPATDRRARVAVLAGGAACLAALVVAALLGGAGWRAWLAAAFVWSAIPIGAVGLLMMIRLIPGSWRDDLTPLVEAEVLLLPIGALLILPLMFATHPLYAWAGEHQPTAFRAAYFSPLLFAVRTLVCLAVLAVLAFVLVVRHRTAPAVSCVGLVLFATLGTVAVDDWLLSLDPEFASSGFGLYGLCLQMLLALSAAIGAAILLGRPIARLGVLGGLLLTAILLWAYFAFMQFFITWSDNLPPGVRWYQARGSGAWGVVGWVVALARLGPGFLLLFDHVRSNRRRMLVLSGVVFAATALEVVWLALPVVGEGPEVGAAAVALALVGVAAMGAVAAGAFPLALAWRDGRRSGPEDGR